jgi:hypothetical protein
MIWFLFQSFRETTAYLMPGQDLVVLCFWVCLLMPFSLLCDIGERVLLACGDCGAALCKLDKVFGDKAARDKF